MIRNLNCCWLTVLIVTFSFNPSAEAKQTDSTGQFYAEFNLRYETVDQDNALQDADDLTLRSRLGFVSPQKSGFSVAVELEDSRSLFGMDDYSVPQTGFRPGQFSVIADPETTELDQAFVKYRSGGFHAKLGRQVFTLDNQRFVGHVGWRQDRQTFDGITLQYAPNKQWKFTAAHLVQRNRIFADDLDIDSQDTLLNLSYKSSAGVFSAYSYLLEVDDGTTNSLDTYGLRYKGKSTTGDTEWNYVAEFATQETQNNIDTDYLHLNGSVKIAGVTAKLGFESLGSDNGNGAFVTPLATLHKFNGWSDQFLATPSQGLEDLYISASSALAGGKLSATYHDFSADVNTGSGSDLGSEWNMVYSRKFAKRYTGGLKLAAYSSGDPVFNKVDTDKVWVWLSAKF